MAWEYKHGWNDNIETMNMLGERGWECLAVINIGHGNSREFYYKRPKVFQYEPEITTITYAPNYQAGNIVDEIIGS